MKKIFKIIGTTIICISVLANSIVATAAENQIVKAPPKIFFNYLKENLIPYSEEDLKYMSSIIYCEAGNQCKAGQQAVGIVVMNRVESESFSNSVKEVLYEEGQFGPVITGWIEDILVMYENGEMPIEYISSAAYALRGEKTVCYEEEEINLDSCLYFNGELLNAKIRIQDHSFK